MNSYYLFYRRLIEALTEDRILTLATVVKSSGSAPREAGAQLFCTKKQEFVGTVGGGSLEGATQDVLLRLLNEPGAERMHYALRPNQAADLGMVCGGDVTIVAQTLTPQSLPLLNQYLAYLEENQQAYIGVYEKIDGLALYHADFHQVNQEAVLQTVQGEIKVEGTLFKGYFVQAENYTCFRFLDQGKLYVFGGGHVGQALVRAIQELDFHTVVFDDREMFVDMKLFPGAARTVLGNFENLAESVKFGKADQACIVTRGHLFDYEVLKQVLRTDVGYIGLMGSRRKIHVTFEKLLAEGFSEADLTRIHTPIGLPILAQTPAEIAISIAAELIHDRALRKTEA